LAVKIEHRGLRVVVVVVVVVDIASAAVVDYLDHNKMYSC